MLQVFPVGANKATTTSARWLSWSVPLRRVLYLLSVHFHCSLPSIQGFFTRVITFPSPPSVFSALLTNRCWLLKLDFCNVKFQWFADFWWNTDYFLLELIKGDVTQDDSQRRFLAQHSVATLLPHCFEWFQHCSNITTLCCAKNRRCESSRVTLP